MFVVCGFGNTNEESEKRLKDTVIFCGKKEGASLFLRVVLASICCRAIKIDPIDEIQSVTPFGDASCC